MNECERLEVVRRVNEIKDKINLLESMTAKYDEMFEDEKVKSFLALSKEIEALRKDLSIYNNDIESIISIEFRETFINRLEHKKMSPCGHDIWMYEGSFTYIENLLGIRTYVNCDDENSKSFHHNEYVCLECGQTVSVSDYVDFESNNCVLKKRITLDDVLDADYRIKVSDIMHFDYVNYYRELYYKYLYYYGFEEAKKMLIEEFRQDFSRKFDNKWFHIFNKSCV